MKRIVLRADGNNKIGLGHIYRLAALGEMLKNDFECRFAIDQPAPFIIEMIQKTGIDLITFNSGLQSKVPDQISPGEEIPFDLGSYLKGDEIVVMDGYLFGKEYQLSSRKAASAVVCIDDYAKDEYFADLVLNHAPGLNISELKVQSYTTIKTGLDYAMIRPVFFSPFSCVEERTKTVFICLGGADMKGYTLQILKYLLSGGDFSKIHILCSPAFSKELLEQLIQKALENTSVNLHFNLNADELVCLIDSCTYAFVSASTVLLEVWSRGLKCYTGYYTENQKNIYKGFVDSKMAIGLGHFGELTSDRFNMVLEKTTGPIVNKVPLQSKDNLVKAFAQL